MVVVFGSCLFFFFFSFPLRSASGHPAVSCCCSVSLSRWRVPAESEGFRLFHLLVSAFRRVGTFIVAGTEHRPRLPRSLSLPPVRCWAKKSKGVSLARPAPCPKSEADPRRELPPSARPGPHPSPGAAGERGRLRASPLGQPAPHTALPQRTSDPARTISHLSRFNSGLNAALMLTVF